MQRFVLFALPRTGSSWLRAALNSHPEITCHSALLRRGEWVLRESGNIASRMPPELHTAEARIDNFENALEAIFTATDAVPHAGLKFMLTGSPRILEYLASNPSYRNIVIRRDNLLAVYASNELAKKTGQGYAKPGEKVRRDPIWFDADDFERWRAGQLARYEKLTGLLSGDMIGVDYMGLRQGRDIEYLGEFFGVDPSLMDLGSTLKRGSDDIPSRFRNPDDVRAHLRKIGKEQWAFEGVREPA